MRWIADLLPNPVNLSLLACGDLVVELLGIPVGFTKKAIEIANRHAHWRCIQMNERHVEI